MMLFLPVKGFSDSTLKFENPSSLIYTDSNEKKEFKAGEKLNLEKTTQPMMIFSEGRAPVVIVPVCQNSAELTVKNPDIKEWALPLLQQEIDKELSTVMLSIKRIELNLKKRKFDLAQSQLNAVQEKYPNVAYFDFLRASLLLLTGDRTNALSALKKAMTVHPNDPAGQQLLKTLGGQK